jgi:hypothetical protein
VSSAANVSTFQGHLTANEDKTPRLWHNWQTVLAVFENRRSDLSCDEDTSLSLIAINIIVVFRCFARSMNEVTV